MYREILFRGKRMDNGEWVYGFILHAQNDDSWCITNEVEYLHDVDGNTVGQYTGLTDKNGVKIFEGDYVHVHDTMLQCSKPYHEFNGYISFSDGSFIVVDEEWNEHYRLMDYEMEVIWNIYDNPVGGLKWNG